MAGKMGLWEGSNRAIACGDFEEKGVLLGTEKAIASPVSKNPIAVRWTGAVQIVIGVR